MTNKLLSVEEFRQWFDDRGARMNEIELPQPDTASLARSGRSVDYIDGYEAGYEAAAEQVRQAVMAERARCATLADNMLGADADKVAAAIRRG